MPGRPTAPASNWSTSLPNSVAAGKYSRCVVPKMRPPSPYPSTTHNADDMAAAFQELKGQQGMPRVLQAMFEEAGLLPNEDPDDEAEK